MFSFRKNNLQNNSDEVLMQLNGKGNKLAFELLYERYFEKLVWYAKGYVNNLETAQDIVQEVFISVIKQPEKFDISKVFSTWIYTLTGNKCKNYLRDNKIKDNKIELQDVHYNLQHSALHHNIDFSHTEIQIQQIYATLTPREKQLYDSRFIEKKSIKETAERLQIPEGSVKSGTYYLLKKFSSILKQHSYEY